MRQVKQGRAQRGRAPARQALHTQRAREIRRAFLDLVELSCLPRTPLGLLEMIERVLVAGQVPTPGSDRAWTRDPHAIHTWLLSEYHTNLPLFLEIEEKTGVSLAPYRLLYVAAAEAPRATQARKRRPWRASSVPGGREEYLRNLRAARGQLAGASFSAAPSDCARSRLAELLASSKRREELERLPGAQIAKLLGVSRQRLHMLPLYQAWRATLDLAAPRS